ncbi:hypothetical protein GCM10025880_15160 [Methylorubrum aminovorans]|nr:hypothetical protein GCM10025880_15160 [Methylorubrum aminovorans]
MSFLICLAALFFLMAIAYRGFSVILFAPVAAMGAVLLTDPSAVPTLFSGLFMEKLVGFLKLYFPVFLLGAVFGKLIEISGFARSIVGAVTGLLGEGRAIVAIVLVGAILTYGGVSLFVAVFAVYPFAAELFRRSNIPKRLIPGTIALGAFTFTMDTLPGTPQIQNIIPASFFKTDAYAAPGSASSARSSCSASASPISNGAAVPPGTRATARATPTSRRRWRTKSSSIPWWRSCRSSSSGWATSCCSPGSPQLTVSRRAPR